MSAARVIAVIDLGSNSIKLHVLQCPGFRLLHHAVRYTRISRGMEENEECIGEVLLQEAVSAVRALLEEAHPHEPQHYEVVATSAVREARNQAEVVERLEKELELPVRVLSGLEEAVLIGKGARTDRGLADLKEGFTLVDLGGGSLECIDYAGEEVRQVVSLALGAVRMTEAFVLDAQEVIPFQEVDNIFVEASGVLGESTFDLGQSSRPVVGAGGAFVVARAMLAQQVGKELSRSTPVLEVKAMGHVLTQLCGLNLKERCALPGMAGERADIMPAALAVLLAVADLAQINTFLHTYHNLSYGVAAEWAEDEE